jgi:hypothetical protein
MPEGGEMPDYFTSYARADRDRYLDRFVTDLKKEVRSKTGVQPEEIEDLWFFDTTSIKTGDDWADVLGDALRHAKICICLCSPTYFLSQFCGKEFRVFLERREEHLKAATVPNQRARVILPIVWELPNGDLPELVGRFQYTDDNMPDKYTNEGLKTLTRVNGRRGVYWQCVNEFALKIRDALNQTQLPPRGPLPPFEEIVSAFVDAGDSSFGVSAVYVAQQGGDWAPFGDESLRSLLASQVGAMKLTCREIPLDVLRFETELNEARSRNDTIVVMVDPHTVTAGPIPAVLAPFRKGSISNAVLLPIWRGTGAAAEAEVQPLLESVGTALGAGEHELIGSKKELRSRIDRDVTRIRGRLLKSADAERVAVDTDLERNAEEDGIDLDTQPRVRGPGGDE